MIINDTGHYPVTFCDYQNEWGAQLDVIENKMYPGQSSEIIVVFSAKKNIPCKILLADIYFTRIGPS